MRQISRFIHVSDLHLTRYDPLSGKPVFTGARALWNTAYSGFWGHSFDSQIALEDFFVDQQRHHGPTELILTGDLTSIGHPDEFAHAREYIESSVGPTQAAPYGLQAGSCRLKIPGNP